MISPIRVKKILRTSAPVLIALMFLLASAPMAAIAAPVSEPESIL